MTVQAPEQTVGLQTHGTVHSLNYYLALYIVISTITGLVGAACFLYSYVLSIKASKVLFEAVTSTVLRTPLRWLDTVPTGRILNRFTADFDKVDNQLACNIMLTTDSILDALGICVAAMLATPWLLLPAAVLCLACAHLGKIYLAAGRPTRRLESNSKSPMFELYSTVLSGMTTIRASGAGPAYLAKMQDHLDTYGVTSRHIALFDRWLTIRMAVAGTAFAGAAGCLVLLVGGIGAPLAGFTMSFALNFSGAMNWVVRFTSRTEMDMNAAERVVEYTKLQTEDKSGARPPAAWPAQGRVEVDKLVVAYAEDLPPVLKGVSFAIGAGERMGVVGRTGAGKSSLTLALFRFLEAREGSIYIDGLDISGVNLHDLRSRLAIIPQVCSPCYIFPPSYTVTDVTRTLCSSRVQSARTWTPSTTTLTSNSPMP